KFTYTMPPQIRFLDTSNFPDMSLMFLVPRTLAMELILSNRFPMMLLASSESHVGKSLAIALGVTSIMASVNKATFFIFDSYSLNRPRRRRGSHPLAAFFLSLLWSLQIADKPRTHF